MQDDQKTWPAALIKNEVLDNLVKTGEIVAYQHVNIDEDGNIGKQSKFRNTEQVIIIFPSKRRLAIRCLCSGSSENTTLDLTSY